MVRILVECGYIVWIKKGFKPNAVFQVQHDIYVHYVGDGEIKEEH